MRVINEQGEDQAPGEIGEVVFRGNNLMKGYYKDPEATEEAMRGRLDAYRGSGPPG